FHLSPLRLRALVRGRRELTFGQSVYAVVLEDVGHIHPAAHDVRELPQTDRGRVAVARDAKVDQLAVGEVRAGEHGRHAAVHGVEAVRVAGAILRGLGAA